MINIIQAPSLSKDQIYIQTNSWFVHTFNSGKSVIQLNEKDAGTILAKGYLKTLQNRSDLQLVMKSAPMFFFG